MSADLRVRLGRIELKNPIIAGSGEATIDGDGIRAALAAGAAAVVAKSTNESETAMDQLEASEYLLLDADSALTSGSLHVCRRQQATTVWPAF